jgi:lipopolysaccharide transport system permease protein
VNPHAPQPVSLVSMFASLGRNRELILLMSKREIVGRYKGSSIGVLWSLLNPLFLLAVYSFVFSVVFQARWGLDKPSNQFEFAILLFVGMIVHGLFSETLLRAPSLILHNVSYVKKIVFPLEILPIISICVAIFHASIGLCIVALAVPLLGGSLSWTVLLTPLVFAPLVLLTAGLAWGLAALGVYLRDVAQPIGLLMTVLLFASPVFYPLSALPEVVRPWLMLNPLSFIIEQARNTVIFGKPPDWVGLVIYSVVALMTAWTGYVWFQKTRKGFANVL